jgi:hypothetical protein
VRQVGTDHDQRLVATPQALQHLGHLGRLGLAHRQRHQRETLTEHALQERQLDLQRMLRLMWQIGPGHLAQIGQ